MEEELLQDLNEVEDALCRTADRCDIWQDRIIHLYGRVLYHLLKIEIKRLRRDR